MGTVRFSLVSVVSVWV